MISNNTYTIFIIDDEKSIRQGVSLVLKKHYKIKAFSNAETALGAIANDSPDLILLDIGLPGMNGIEALKKIKEYNPDILVIMITAFEDIHTVVSAMKIGARDYIVKPVHMDSLKVTIKNALESIKMRKEIQVLQEKYLKDNIPCFIGESSVIQDVMQVVNKVAKSPDTPVFILGETGTGKELIVSAIHYKSPNFNGPFVSLNCAAIPKNLIESELFGYEKGAFSGASESGKKGFVEEAANGTLFLDEVGDLSLAAQAKLLRFLDDGEFYRVGGSKKLKVRTRIVSATNKCLERMIEKGLFRQDLYYRLAVVKIEVPSLNERRDDIIPIAEYFLVEFSKKHHKSFTKISPQTESFLKGYQWKGNIRELRNLIERGVLIGDGSVLTMGDLGLERENKNNQMLQSQKKPSFSPIPEEGINLNDLEEHYLKEALQKTQGNVTKAAKFLNLSYYSFRYRLRKIKSSQF